MGSCKLRVLVPFCRLSVINHLPHFPLFDILSLPSQSFVKLATVFSVRTFTFDTNNTDTVSVTRKIISSNESPIPEIAPVPKCKRCLCTTSSNNEENYKIVYTGSISKRVTRVKMVSIAGSLMGLAFLPKLLNPVLQTSISSAVLLICCSSFFIIATPLILHWMCRRYVTELKYDSNKKLFRATVISLFLRKKQFEFSAHEVVVPGTPLLLTSFLVRGYPFLVDAEDFTDLDVYKHLMGYDKPVDLQMKNTSKQP